MRRPTTLRYQPNLLLSPLGDNVVASGTVIDRSGGGNNATLVGNAYVANGVLKLDGNGDYASVNNFPGCNPGASDFTFFCRVKRLADAPARQLVGKWEWTPGDYRSWHIRLQANKLEARISSNGADDGAILLTGSTVLALNTWYSAALVRRSNTIYTYLNAEVECTGTFTSSIFSSTRPVFIGTFGAIDAYYFTGELADIAFYGRALTDNEIKQISGVARR